MIKGDLRTLVRVTIGDTPAARISDLGLDLMIQMKSDELWSVIFSIDPFYRVTRQTGLAPGAPGFVDVSSGLTGRFYRLQTVGRGGQTYREIDSRYLSFDASGNVTAVDVGSQNFKYFWRGSQLHLLPYSMTADVDVTYSSRPPLYSTLADSAVVVWPDGHEAALIKGTAADILRSDKDLRSQANTAEEELRAAISRRSIGPLVPFQTRTPQEDGAE